MRNTAVNLILSGISIVTVFLIGNFGMAMVTHYDKNLICNPNKLKYLRLLFHPNKCKQVKFIWLTLVLIIIKL